MLPQGFGHSLPTPALGKDKVVTKSQKNLESVQPVFQRRRLLGKERREEQVNKRRDAHKKLGKAVALEGRGIQTR